MLRVVVQATEIMDSMQLVLVSVAAKRPPTPKRRRGEHRIESLEEAGRPSG